jgi:hypothetical protein
VEPDQEEIVELELDQENARSPLRIRQEKLRFNQKILIEFSEGNVRLYQDDSSEDITYPFDWNRSALGALPSRQDNTLLTWFKERLKKFIVVQINPMAMTSESLQENEFLDKQCSNFTDWYRLVSQNQGKVFEITKALQEVLDGFKYFEFEKVGENRSLLKAQIGEAQYRFHELSDGQRMLIVLYSLIHFAHNQRYTLCIDEPENFVSLPEIQPWLFTLHDACADNELQALFISHHPEYINYLADSSGLWFERKQNAPVRVRPVSGDENGLAPAELAARGWIDE